MYQNTRHAAVSSVRVNATVTDTSSVQRVLTLLTGRNYSLTRFEAEEAGGGRWRLRIEALAEREDVEILAARLQRVPSTLVVDVQWIGGSPAVPGPGVIQVAGGSTR
jgi:hypothetical protein